MTGCEPPAPSFPTRTAASVQQALEGIVPVLPVSGAPPQINVVLNWHEELKRLVPAN